MSDFTNNDLCMKLADAIVSNLNKLFEQCNVSYEIDFENASKLLDNYLAHFYVQKDKSSELYEKSKKSFSKILSCNYNFIKDKLDLSTIDLNDEQKSNFIELFEDGPNKHWTTFLFILMSYISFVKQSNKDPNINYSGMIDKLMKKIEEYNESEETDEYETESNAETNDLASAMEQFELDTNPQELLNQLKQQMPAKNDNSSNVMKGLLGDIKGMLSGGQNLDTQNIMDLSKNLSVKYQDMIENGSVNITDLFSGVMDLLNNPDAIGEEFGDINTDNLPNPNDLINQMSSDPNLKQAMAMMGNMGAGPSNGQMGGLNMGMLGAMMSGMMGGSQEAVDPNAPKTVQELEKEIERLMTEMHEETEASTEVDTKSNPSQTN